MREVDVRHRCPLCRTELKYDSIVPNPSKRSVINNLMVYCKHGLKKDPSCAGMTLPHHPADES